VDLRLRWRGDGRHELRYRLIASSRGRSERTIEHGADRVRDPATLRRPRRWDSDEKVMDHGSQAIHVAPLVGLVAGESFRTGIVGAPLPLNRWVGLLSRGAFQTEADQLDKCTRAGRNST
jgi:hypothetical protein